jgi:hypothetical protein
LGEEFLDEKYMGGGKIFGGKWEKIGVIGMLTFVPPFSGR